MSFKGANLRSVTGSFGNPKTTPGLTPFEQADYNLAKFVLNAQLSMELDSIVRRVSALEKMRDKFLILLDTSESVTLVFSTKKRLEEIEEELVAAEFVLQTICATYGQEM